MKKKNPMKQPGSWTEARTQYERGVHYGFLHAMNVVTLVLCDKHGGTRDDEYCVWHEICQRLRDRKGHSRWVEGDQRKLAEKYDMQFPTYAVAYIPEARPCTKLDEKRLYGLGKKHGERCVFTLFLTIMADDGYDAETIRNTWKELSNVDEMISEGYMSERDLVDTVNDEYDATITLVPDSQYKGIPENEKVEWEKRRAAGKIIMASA